MPEYLYTDGEHSQPVLHRMMYSTAIFCEDCGALMWRVPQVARINWNGNRAVHEMHPDIKRLIDTAPERRDKFLQEHEEHERRSQI